MTGYTGVGKSSNAEIAALRLTCLNPDRAEPCGICANCKQGIVAIQENGRSQLIRKVNLALIKDKTDVADMIKEIFRIDSGSSNIVFILEEPHMLLPVHQTALLEEIDRIPNNVYVIMCTTKINMLLPEFKGRALRFKFNNLEPKEAKLLIDKSCTRLGLRLSEKMKEVVRSYTRGVPREIENILKFISTNNGCISEEEFKQFLQETDYDSLRLLLKSSNNLADGMEMLDSILSSSTLVEFLYSFKDYLMNLAFLARDISYRETSLSAEDKRFAKEIGFSTILSIYNELKKSNINDSLSDFQFHLIKIYSIMGKRTSKILTEEGIKEESTSQFKRSVESSDLRRSSMISSSKFASSKLDSRSFGDIINENTD